MICWSLLTYYPIAVTVTGTRDHLRRVPSSAAADLLNSLLSGILRLCLGASVGNLGVVALVTLDMVVASTVSYVL